MFDATTYVNPIQPPILFYALTYLCGLILVYLAFSSVEFNDAPTYFKKIFFTYLISMFLIIIIGLALFAFVLDPSTLGDFFNSSNIYWYQI